MLYHNTTSGKLMFKVFASPGIDSGVDEYGSFNSGVGRDPSTDTTKASPTDWHNDSPTDGHETGRLVGNFSATQAKPINSIAIRRRGLAPFGGFFSGRRSQTSRQHIGGIVDHNAGADKLIAGGDGQASTFCRVNGGSKKGNRGAKLPVLPPIIMRGGQAALPSGGGSHEPLTAPIRPTISGWPTIFSFTGSDSR